MFKGFIKIMEQIVKNQHYIPEALLKNFVNSEGRLIEVLLRNKRMYPTNPSNSMSEKFAYECEGLKTNTVENYFAKIDSIIPKKIKLIIDQINDYKIDKTEFLEIKEKIEELIPIFIIFYYRSGALLKEFSSFKKEDRIPLLSKKILNILSNPPTKSVVHGFLLRTKSVYTRI